LFSRPTTRKKTNILKHKTVLNRPSNVQYGIMTLKTKKMVYSVFLPCDKNLICVSMSNIKGHYFKSLICDNCKQGWKPHKETIRLENRNGLLFFGEESEHN